MTAKRHHYVPKCYLNAFGAAREERKNPELVSFDSVDKKRFVTAPSNVALEKDFNTIDLEGHEPDAFETAMASVESDMGPALTRIRESESLENDDDKILLLNFLCLLYVRNPRMREMKQSMHDTTAKIIGDLLLSDKKTWDAQIKKAQEAGYVAKDADTSYEKAKSEATAESFKIKVSTNEHIQSEMNVFDHALPLLFDRKWILIKAHADSAGFITSDHPVSLVWTEPPKSRIPKGLKTPGTELFCPLSPRLAVVGAYEIDDGLFEANADAVASMNGTTILNAHRQVYALNDDFIYQIDQSKSPLPASNLIEDGNFR